MFKFYSNGAEVAPPTHFHDVKPDAVSTSGGIASEGYVDAHFAQVPKFASVEGLVGGQGCLDGIPTSGLVSEGIPRHLFILDDGAAQSNWVLERDPNYPSASDADDGLVVPLDASYANPVRFRRTG